jgi:hypothetical protein
MEGRPKAIGRQAGRMDGKKEGRYPSAQEKRAVRFSFSWALAKRRALPPLFTVKIERLG